MPDIKEVDAAEDFGLTLNQFYSIVKQQIGNIQSQQYIQLQATALPFDVDLEYKWFSYGNINRFFDIRLDPAPIADTITLLGGAKLSAEYLIFIADILALVEMKELDKETLSKIDELSTKVLNNGSRIGGLLDKRALDWAQYAQASMVERGSSASFNHWIQGHWATREINDLQKEQARDQALVSALRLKKYADPSHQAVVDAYEAATSSASRMRYPRFPDKEYVEDVAKFGPVFFAALADNDSNLFSNRQLMTPGSSLSDITTSNLGGFSDIITRQSVANSTITTDWSAKASAGYGPFSFTADVNSHTQIKDDFSHLQSITVGATSLQAVAIDASSWFNPSMFSHPLVLSNKALFDRYFGEKGSLLYYPTNIIIARGMNLKFSSTQDWQYDYESSFSAGGNASAKVFGIKFGGGGKYSQAKKEQKVEKRGNELTLSDGENIRILGYIATKNTAFSDSIKSEAENKLDSLFF